MLGVVATRGVSSVVGRSQRFRALRHLCSEFAVGALIASAWHARLHALKGVCDNVSLHGLCMRLPLQAASASLLHIEDRLTGLHVSLSSGEVVVHGDGLVRQMRVEGQDLLVGLSLLQGVVDLPLLFEQQTRSQFSARVEEAERSADTARILPAFKEWVADLRSYLESMRLFLDREEASLLSEDLYTRQRTRAQYIAEIGPRLIERVHAASHAMGTLLAGLTEEEHALHRPYAQQHLGSLFDTSPLMRRALQKPLGYAGDYEMMNMLYRSHEEGASLFGQVMNMAAAGEVAARANVNRLTYLSEKLAATIEALPEHDKSRRGERAQVASIGSGPARELDALLAQHPRFGPLLDVMLVDQDLRAISFCEQVLTPVALATGARFHFVRESIRRLLTGGSLASTLGQRDLIYSAGLFDYLSDRSFSTLLMALYDAVKPGGCLIVGNVNINNPTRYFMEYFLEWFLVHRSPAQLRDQARFLRPTPKSVRLEAEPLGVNLFLVIEK